MNLLDTIKNFFKRKHSGLQAERLTLIQQIEKLYKFLIIDFGYELDIRTESDKNPGGPEFYFIKYTNQDLNRQVELVLHRNSTVVYRYLKRLKNGIEPSYKDINNCIPFYQVDFYNGIDDHDRSNPYNPPDYELAVVKFGRETLLNNLEIIKGEKWLDRDKLNELFLEKKGYPAPDGENELFKGLIQEFKFLVSDLDFQMIHNYNDLAPFKRNLGGSLVYSNDRIVVRVSVDLRDQFFSVKILDKDDYELNSFHQRGKEVFNGSTNENDIKEAARITRNEVEIKSVKKKQ